MDDLINRVSSIKQKVNSSYKQSAYLSFCPEILAVSKTRTINEILAVKDLGLSNFAENYLQEAIPKILKLTDQDIIWHFIGKLQSNKVKKAASYFNWVHSVDSLKLANKLNTCCALLQKKINICLQINIARETAKTGIIVGDKQFLINLALEISKLNHLQLRGLMTILPKSLDPETTRDYYSKLRLLFELLINNGLKLDTLSMGMSGDFKLAILEGATIVRIGQAIFGKRILAL